MQPTEHKQPTDEELIAHIRQGLKAHEEPYAIGAWEKFKEQQQPKKRPIFWLASLSGVAALLAICFTLFFLTNKKTTQVKEQFSKSKATKNVAPSKGSSMIKDLSGEEETTVRSSEQAADRAVVLNTSHTSAAFTSQNNTIANVDPMQLDQNQIASNQQTGVMTEVATTQMQNGNAVAKTDAPVVAKIIEETKPNIVDFLANETKKNEATAQKNHLNKKESRWVLGLMVSPSFDNNRKLNMGYGVSMGYNLTSKIALSSGIGYSEMTASKNLPTASSMSIVVANAKNLESIDEKVVGLDIPLEIKYHINKNVYANFGISAFAVLNQKRKNTYVEDVIVYGAPNANASRPAGVAGPAGAVGSVGNGSSSVGGQFANSYIVNQRTTEQVPLSTNENNYLGFYNLSFGYKKRISRNNSVAIEPFMKLPIKEINTNNLKLVGTGLRLKVDF